MVAKSKAKPKSEASATAPQVAPDASATAPMEKASKKVRAVLSVVVGGKNAGPSGKQPASALPPAPRKPKRTLSSQNLGRTLGNALKSGPALVRGLTQHGISPALREKIILGVTSVNDCRYCKWGHSHWAMAHGVSLDEVNQILGHQNKDLQATNAAEAAAIFFAQQYAENYDHFEPAAVAQLLTHYSQAQVGEIVAYIHAITLGNLLGNTVDAFLSRFSSNGHTSIFLKAPSPQPQLP